METIINYLENMFRNLPNTVQMRKLKEEILSNMEDKYLELKNSGKSENEAIGIVISEFGNIDELVEEFELELGLERESGEKILPTMTEEEVNNYLDINKKFAKMISFGVFLFILGPALLILTMELSIDGILPFAEGLGTIAGLVPLFILVIIAIVLFIIAGTRMEKYKYIDYGVEISPFMKHSIEQKNNKLQSSYVLSIIIGVVLLFLAPLTLIIMTTANEDLTLYGVVILLVMVGIAVNLLSYFGILKDGYKKLLKVSEYSAQHKEQNRVIAAVSAIIWPLVVCIYLITGFIFELWHINWIIFPIAALLSSMFSEAYKILNKKQRI